ncbi:MAG: DUF4386 family protein [Cyanobacteria bacterium P01_A01_bin.70]
MSRLQKLGGIAALINVTVAIAMLAVATMLIGVATMSDPNQLIELAIDNPGPLLLQDGLKLIAAAVSAVLVWALASYLSPNNSTLLLVAIGCGFGSVVCLAGNAILSLYTISQATPDAPATFLHHLNRLIGILAWAAIGLDGLWLLLVSGIALKRQQLPRPLCYLGCGMGGLSLVPPLGIIVLLLSMVWSVWLGLVLLTAEPTG